MPSAHPFASTPGSLPGTPSCATSLSATPPSRKQAGPWLNPRLRPPRPHPFLIRTRSRAPSASRASASSTRARTSRTRSPPAAAAGRALDAALAELDAGAKVPSTHWRRRVLAAARPRARAQRGRAAPRRRHAAQPAPGRRALGHADRAAGRGAARRRRAAAPVAAPGARGRRGADEEPLRRRRATSRSSDVELDDDEDEEADEPSRRPRPTTRTSPDEVDEDVVDEAPEDPNAAQALLVRARDRRRQDGRRDGLRRGLAHRRHPDPHPPPQPRRPVPRRAARPRLRRPHRRRRCCDNGGADATQHIGPVTVETYQWFVRNAGRDLRRLHDRHLRRGAHRARREDLRRDPRVDRPDLHRHDGDGRADRPPRHRPLPDADLALRPRAGGAARRDRAAALHPHPARPGRAHDRQGAAAPRRRGRRVRPGDAGRAAGPAAVQPGDRRPLQDALQRRARRRLRRRRAPRLQRRRGVPRRSASRPRRVSGETPKRELAEILAKYERGDIDVLVNAQLLAEGWNSPRATVCMHLAPTASKRIYQQRVGRVTRRHPGKEAGIVVDFVHPGDEARRPGRHAALAARPRRLPRRRDRRRPGAPRPRPARARRAPRACR